MRATIVIVHWIDAAMHGMEQRRRSECENLGPVSGISAGVLVKETDEYVTLATDMFPADGNHEDQVQEDAFRQVSTIPKSGIKQIKRIIYEGPSETGTPFHHFKVTFDDFSG